MSAPFPPVDFVHGETGLTVTVDDDGRVAYAYLRLGDEVLGDVWLYNRGPSPAAVDWTDAAQAPFPNPRSHARELPWAPARRASDFSVEWTVDGELLLADVKLRGVLLGRLSPGSQPGWASLATQDGPCAQVLDDA